MGKRFCWRTENCGRGSDLYDTMPLMKDWKNWVPRRVPYVKIWYGAGVFKIDRSGIVKVLS